MAQKTVQAIPLDGSAETPQHGRTLDSTKDELIGGLETSARKEYDSLLQRKVVSAKLREYRMLNNMSQAELGALIGVQRNQISKLERDSSNVTLGTLFKVFGALGVDIKFSYELLPPRP